ncbi:sedoheptulokinase [Paenibacillus sp. R14(2021)]|uniref:sedoheptulokinase n=1 Tax=Paenibacillus sp. R14(2021) TaxID=2859228 RepID=UPI001C612438|nr:FGGY family carbohydrate kinase [Paenibacillus sp. R14(2021)]
MLVAGIDIGTTSISVVVASAETGETLAVVTRKNDAALETDRSWEHIQDPERIFAIVEELIAECSRHWPDVTAIGVSCQMHGMLYVNREGRSVSPLYTWQDGRGDLPMKTGEDTYSLHLGKLEGHSLSSGYGLVTHYYNTLNGEVPPDAAHLCTIGDYVVMKLTGSAVPVMDPSNAAGFGMFATQALAFETKAVKRAGMDAAMLPRICEGYAAAGVTPDGKKVACAIGDNQASFIGSVPQLEHMLLVNIGTGSQISIYTEGYEEIAGLETRPFPGGGFLLVGAPLSGGKSYALLERFFKETCRSFGICIDDDDIYDRMNEMAGKALEDGAELLRFGTQFYGTRHDPLVLGHIAGLRPDNFTPGHFAAGVLGGIVDELMGYLHLLPGRLLNQIQQAAGSGNGIRKNPVMQQRLQDRLNMPLFLSGAQEEAAFGAALYAASAAGMFPDLKAAMAAMGKN